MTKPSDSTAPSQVQSAEAPSEPSAEPGGSAVLDKLVAALRAGAPWKDLEAHIVEALRGLGPVKRDRAIVELARAGKVTVRAIRGQLEPHLRRSAPEPVEPQCEAEPPADGEDGPLAVARVPGTRGFWQPWRFRGEPPAAVRPPGVWRVVVGREDTKACHVAGPCCVVATVAGPDGQDHGAVVDFVDTNGAKRQVIVDHASRFADPRAVGALLAGRGLLVVDAVELGRYLAYPPREPRKALLAKRAGWLVADGKRAFVLRTGTVVGPLEAVAGPELVAPEPKGSLTDWRCRIAAFAVGNPTFAFAVCVALAGPLVRLLDRPNFGLVLIGPSSTGKTSVAYAVASVWGADTSGNLLRTWNATANGLAAAALEANDSCLVLDEMAAADQHAIQKIIFDLCGDAGRSRARRDGGAAPAASWRGTFLATSERSIENVAGRNLPEGVRGRLVELRVGGGRGAFDTLHGHPSGAALADGLRSAARECHGTAGPAFVQAVLEADVEDLKRRHRAIEEMLGPAESGLEARVRSALGLAALAGALATEADVLPWPPGEAIRAAQWGYARWRSEAGPSERARIVRAVAEYLDRYGHAVRAAR